MIKELLRYNHIANQYYIDAFVKAGKPIPDAERLFSHILNAMHIWCSRINQIVPKVEVFTLHAVSSFSVLQEECEQELQKIITGKDFAEMITYKNTKGEQFTDRISDILIHCVNHSTYHRGQIAAIFRSNDVPPPATDYILFRRKGIL